MIIPPAETDPGEWQREPGTGKRYRMIGNCKEYEPEINGIPESVFHASQKANKKRLAELREIEQQKTREAAALRRNCPFAEGKHTNTDCTRENCALFLNGCMLAGATALKDTRGLQCPFTRYYEKCRTDCALYKNGCTLTSIVKERINNHE